MSKPKHTFKDQIFPILLTGALTFFVTNYWNNQKAEEVLREKRVAVLDDVVTTGTAMANTIKFMSLLSCELGKKRLTTPEQNQREAELNKLIVEGQDRLDRLGNRLTVYFPNPVILSDFDKLNRDYAAALNEQQIRLNEASRTSCKDSEHIALLTRHSNAISSAFGSLTNHMKGFLGVGMEILFK